jgi:hypothetical protein
MPFVIKWVARSIILAPLLGVIAFWLYSNYLLFFTNGKHQEFWLVMGLFLDIVTLIGLIGVVVQFSWLIGNFFRWLWRVAEFPRLPRRPTDPGRSYRGY